MKSTIVLLAICLSLVTTSQAGDQIPNFKLQDLDNQTVELAELLKKGPVLLDFWATWCKPCLKAFPKLNELHNKFKGQGLTVLGVNEDSPRNQAKVKPFVRSLKSSFPVVLDKNNDLMRRLAVRNLPTSILISPEGKIIASYVGYSPTHIEDLKEMIGEIVNEGH